MGYFAVSRDSITRRLTRRLASCGLAASVAAGAFLAAAATGPVTAANATGGGPVVLDGMDPVCHSFSQSTGGYIRAVLSSLYSQASRTNDGSIAVLGSGASTMSCGGTLGSAMAGFISDISPTPTVNYYG